MFTHRYLQDAGFLVFSCFLQFWQFWNFQHSCKQAVVPYFCKVYNDRINVQWSPTSFWPFLVRLPVSFKSYKNVWLFCRLSAISISNGFIIVYDFHLIHNSISVDRMSRRKLSSVCFKWLHIGTELKSGYFFRFTRIDKNSILLLIYMLFVSNHTINVIFWCWKVHSKMNSLVPFIRWRPG